jgi:hypothetical protein
VWGRVGAGEAQAPKIKLRDSSNSGAAGCWAQLLRLAVGAAGCGGHKRQELPKIEFAQAALLLLLLLLALQLLQAVLLRWGGSRRCCYACSHVRDRRGLAGWLRVHARAGRHSRR